MAAEDRVQKSIELDSEGLRLLFGAGDKYLRKLEDELFVDITDRDGAVHILGSEKNVNRAIRLIRDLTEIAKNEHSLEAHKVEYGLELAKEDRSEMLLELDQDMICRTISGKTIRPKTAGQKAYVDAIRNDMVVFGTGPAGTGKTYLAMAMAITAFKQEEVGRIILTRPAIEAGEKLG
ncbi:MAG: PhoH family protein, partial [Lachnospiraceae bacterium]|nr:PhoH family protein [Lachnospiraceae bacterium]